VELIERRTISARGSKFGFQWPASARHHSCWWLWTSGNFFYHRNSFQVVFLCQWTRSVLGPKFILRRIFSGFLGSNNPNTSLEVTRYIWLAVRQIFFVRILVALGTEIKRAGGKKRRAPSPSFKLLPLWRAVQPLEAKLDVGGVLLIAENDVSEQITRKRLMWILKTRCENIWFTRRVFMSLCFSKFFVIAILRPSEQFTTTVRARWLWVRFFRCGAEDAGSSVFLTWSLFVCKTKYQLMTTNVPTTHNFITNDEL